MTVEEQVLEKLRELPPQKQKEVLAFVSLLQEKVQNGTRKSLHGLWAGLDVKVSEADISDARREMWGGFPRDIS
jgi:phage-related protein